MLNRLAKLSNYQHGYEMNGKSRLEAKFTHFKILHSINNLMSKLSFCFSMSFLTEKHVLKALRKVLHLLFPYCFNQSIKWDVTISLYSWSIKTSGIHWNHTQRYLLVSGWKLGKASEKISFHVKQTIALGKIKINKALFLQLFLIKSQVRNFNRPN